MSAHLIFQNIHYCKQIIEEIFGKENEFGLISFTKAPGGLSSVNKLSSRLDYIMKNEQSVSSRSWSGYTTTIKVDVSDIRSVTMGVLMDLNKDLSKALKKYSDKNIKNHIKYSMNMIQSALKSS